VLASDETVNLCGDKKLAKLREQFGDTGFDYAGDSTVDMPLWAAARRALIVGGAGPSPRASCPSRRAA
jgi:hypothetical protein